MISGDECVSKREMAFIVWTFLMVVAGYCIAKVRQ